MKINRDKFSSSVLLLIAALFVGNWAWSAADMGNTSVISPTDASNASGTMPSWSGSAAPSTIDDAGRALQGALAREWQARSAVTSAGTAPAFTVAQTVAPAAYVTGQSYCFTAHAAAVGTDTANFNSLGAKGIKKVVAGVKTATAANDFYTNDKVCTVYDGTDLVWTNRGALDSVAALSTANTFTADQTISSTDAGATSGPFAKLYRNSASPAASDLLGGFDIRGNNTTPADKSYTMGYGVILDATPGTEAGEYRIRTIIGGVQADQLHVANGIYAEGATGSNKGSGTFNAVEYYKNGVIATRTLIATLTTTSGTTHSVTSIPAYRELYIEVAGVSFSASATLALAVSDDNGSNYGTARAISVATGSAGGVLYGTIKVSNIQTTDSLPVAHSVTAIAATATATVNAVVMAEAGGAPAVINAIQFSGGTFDAGTIRVYGLL